MDLSPSADHIGRRESGYGTILIVRGKAGDAADFMKRSFIQEQIDTFPASQFAAVPLPDDAGIGRSGCQPFPGEPPQCIDFPEDRTPRLVCLRQCGSLPAGFL